MKSVVKCGHLFLGNGSAFLANKAIVIEDGKITEILDIGDLHNDRRYDGHAVVDATGKWVMPGLINVHDHLTFRDVIGNPPDVNASSPAKLGMNAARNSITALKRGWTTIRDMGTSYGIAFQYRGFIQQGLIPGPRVLACGSPICATGGHGARLISIEADGVGEARKAARSQLAAGADFIKVMASHDPIKTRAAEKTRAELEVDELKAVFDQAHAHGKLTGGHVMGTVAIGRVLDAGIDCISHGIYLNDDLAQRMAEQNVFFDPTLSSYGRQTLNPRLQRGEAWVNNHLVLVEPLEKAFKSAIRAGVRIVTGTDSAGRYAEDVAMMREFGLSPEASLWACTSLAAEAMGIDDIVGTIEPGKIADIVVLDNDPLKDPYALEAVSLVIQSGKAMRPSDITIDGQHEALKG